MTAYTATPAPRRVPRRRTGATTITRHAAPVCPRTSLIRYRDAHQARDALMSCQWKRARDLAERGTSRRAERRWFRCPECGGYHLTTQAVEVTR